MAAVRAVMAAVAALAAATTTVAAALTEVYPFPNYVRPLAATDPYLASFCVLTGAPAIQMGSGAQRYLGVQTCSLSQIALSPGAPGAAPNAWLSTLGTAAQTVDLGTAATLAATYGETATYYSVRYNIGALAFQVGLDSAPITLPPSAVGALNTTEGSKIFTVQAGHIYLARFTETAGVSASFADTVAALKIFVVDWPADSTDARVPTLRWEVLAGATSAGPTSLQAVNATAVKARNLGAWALAFSIICLVAILGAVAYVVYARRTAGVPAAATLTGATQTTYQTLDK